MNEAFGVTSVLLFIIIFQSGVLAFQHWFYSKQIKDLVERLMARNIQEFERAKNPPPPRNINKPEIPLESFDRIIA